MIKYITMFFVCGLLFCSTSFGQEEHFHPPALPLAPPLEQIIDCQRDIINNLMKIMTYGDVGEREGVYREIIANQLNVIEQLLTMISANVPATPEPELPSLPPVSEPEPSPEPEPDNTVELDNLNLQVYNIFSAKCKDCHFEGGKEEGGLALLGESQTRNYLVKLTLGEMVLLHDRTNGVNLEQRGKTLMPPPESGEPLNDKELELIRLWVIAKAEETKVNK